MRVDVAEVAELRYLLPGVAVQNIDCHMPHGTECMEETRDATG